MITLLNLYQDCLNIELKIIVKRKITRKLAVCVYLTKTKKSKTGVMHADGIRNADEFYLISNKNSPCMRLK